MPYFGRLNGIEIVTIDDGAMLNSPSRQTTPQRSPVEASVTTWAPLLREALAAEGRFRWPLRGASMRPTLPSACEIDIVPLPDQTPLGSLIVFASGNTLIAHRLVRRAGKYWIVQGDGRLGPDRPLLPEQVLGLVTAAHLDGRCIWPSAAEKAARWYWVARHHLLRPLRFTWHCLKGKNRPNRKEGPIG